MEFMDAVDYLSSKITDATENTSKPQYIAIYYTLTLNTRNYK